MKQVSLWEEERFDWTEQLGKDFCRYFNRYLWRTLSLQEYKPRKNEAPPFATCLAARSQRGVLHSVHS